LQRGRHALPRLAEEMTRREAALGRDDVATIMYTSGTTGNPKGVVTHHRGAYLNAVSNILARDLGQHPRRPSGLTSALAHLAVKLLIW